MENIAKGMLAATVWAKPTWISADLSEHRACETTLQASNPTTTSHLAVTLNQSKPASQPPSKQTSLQGSRIQSTSLQASKHPGIHASKPANLQDWSLLSSFRRSSPAAKAATGRHRIPQAAKPRTPEVHEIYLKPPKSM